ncbi:hypothetical protein NDU88_000199 [Pleurodeles waltl]|uniref:Uncharacterized protein n=1 Tax=Pleurodeles waltl TaxID=8319 RepID=A0AAV7R9B7_PLEWA|nr:hypothetical protein NDU88_000199 [Pleurodeles waltl]
MEIRLRWLSCVFLFYVEKLLLMIHMTQMVCSSLSTTGVDWFCPLNLDPQDSLVRRRYNSEHRRVSVQDLGSNLCPNSMPAPKQAHVISGIEDLGVIEGLVYSLLSPKEEA